MVFGIIFLVFAHISLAIYYASITPYRTPGIDVSAGKARIADVGAPDERAHENYIQWLLDGKGWPVLDINKMKSDPVFRAEQYESHQPPLYYLIEAGMAKASGVRDVSNPDAKWPLRAPNVLFGASTVLAVFFICIWTFGDPLLALAASLFPALLPMSTALSGAVSNDPLIITLSTWVIALLALCIQKGWTKPRFFWIILLTAAACWTKTTGLLLLPVILVASVLPGLHKPKFANVLIAFAAFLVIASPVWIHNQANYGDPFAISAFNDAFADTAQHSTIANVISAQGGNPSLDYWTKWVGWWTFRSFVGVFGYMDIWLNASGSPYPSPDDKNLAYVLCLVVGLCLCFGWSQFVKRESDPNRRAVQWVLALDLFLVVASFLSFNNHYFQAQGRYLYPAIGAISVGLGLGACALGKKHAVWVVLCLMAGLLWLQFIAVSTLPAQFEKRITMNSFGQNVYNVEAS